MPRSVLLGRAVASGEALWLPEDRWWALALLEVEADNCSDCGQPLSESTAPEGEFAYDAEAVRCHGCTAATRRVRALTDGGAVADGIKVSTYRKEAAGVGHRARRG